MIHLLVSHFQHCIHKINGGCFLTVKSTRFTPIFNFQVINSSYLTFTYSGDITHMMTEVFEYTLIVINVSNPVSIIPIQYILVISLTIWLIKNLL